MEEEDDDKIFSMSWSGLLGATATVLITTLDDSIWLVSFVGTSSLPIQARLVNAASFLSSLLGLSILCCALAIGIEKGLETKTTSLEAEELLELRLEWIAVILCWLLAAGFYTKKQLKKRQRRRQQQQQEQGNGTIESMEEQQGSSGSYGSIPSRPQEAEEAEESGGNDPTTTIGRSHHHHHHHHHAQPCAIISLTTLGFLDEISYFPALVVGQIFTVSELVLGTLVAGMAMLGIQAFLASQCKPFIDWLDDHVQLHGIIAVFALILTINLIIEYTTMMD